MPRARIIPPVKFRQSYLTYPDIAEAFPARLLEQLGKVGTVPPLLPKRLRVPSEKLLTKPSYSHLELLNVEDPLKRTFYEIECIKRTCSSSSGHLSMATSGN